MASRTIRGITIEFGADTSDLLKSFSKLKHESTQLTKKFNDMNNLLKFNPKNVELMTQKQQELKKQIESTNDRLKTLNKMQDELKLKGLDENSDEFKALRREIIDTEKSLETYKKQLGSVNEGLNIQNSKLGQMGEKFKTSGKFLEQQGKKLKEMGSNIQGVGDKMTKGITLPVVGMGVAVSKAAVDFESSFAGVRKTVDATESEYKKLSEGIRSMSKEIPASASAIAQVTESAGQLGIQKENLLDFTRVMIDLGEATNMSAEEGASQLAKFANITQMSQDKFSNLGSVIVDLGNNFATTEADIVNMGMNLAGAGKQVGLTEADIMSFATALSSVGLEAQAGGSAFSKVMVEMQLATEIGGESLDNFAKVAGMSSEEFKQAFQKDASGAIIEFVKGLKESEKNGISAIKVLDDMGISEVRLRDALLRASGASEVFSKAIDTGNKAWEENNALTKEAEQRYSTTESKLKIAKNKAIDLAIGFGQKLLPSVIKLSDKGEQFLSWLDKLDSGTKDNIIQMAALAAAGGPVLKVFGLLTSGASSAIGGLGKLSTSIGGVATKIAAKGGIVAAAKGGMASLGAFGTKALAVATGPVGIAIAAITALGIGGVIAAKKLSEDAVEEVDLFGEGVSEGTAKAVGAFLELEEEATNALNQLNWSGQEVTKELSDNIVGKFSEMKTQVVSKLTEQKDEQLSVLQEMFEDSLSFNISEKEETLRILEEGYTERVAKMNEREAEIKAIMDLASQEKRALTEEERSQINLIKQGMRDDGVQILSESEAEYKVIMQRMHDQGSQISARGAAEVVQNSLEQKEKTIENANLEYDERIRLAEQIRAQGGAEAEETANKIIAEAKRQRDDTVEQAESMHLEVIDEAKKQAKEHVNEVDWETGEIKSKWDILKEDISNKAGEIWENVTDWFSEIGSSARDKFDEVKENIMGPIKEAKEWLDDKISSFKEAFNFSWSLPKFKLPSISVTKATGILGIPYPKFSVNWNKEGYVAKRPMILPDAYGGFQGIAEPSTGGEAVMPLNKLPELMAEAMEKAKIQTKNIVVNYISLDGKVIAREVTEQVDNNLSIISSRSRLAGGLT